MTAGQLSLQQRQFCSVIAAGREPAQAAIFLGIPAPRTFAKAMATKSEITETIATMKAEMKAGNVTKAGYAPCDAADKLGINRKVVNNLSGRVRELEELLVDNNIPIPPPPR